MTTLIIEPPAPLDPLADWLAYRAKLEAKIAKQPGNANLEFARGHADDMITTKQTSGG